MFRLATKAKHPGFTNHVNVPADPTRGRLPQAERACRLCGLVKITAFPGDGRDPFRLWRYPGSDEQIELYDTPECVPAPAPEVAG